jgi:periplasmic protein TonB
MSVATARPQTALPPAPVVTPEDRLALTFSLALLLHGALILGVSFVAPERVPPEYLDVILVQQADPTPNPEAQLLAQANNLGGGDEAAEVSPSAPFESPLPAPTPEVVMAQSPAPPAPASPPAPTPPPVAEVVPEPEPEPPPVAEVQPEPAPPEAPDPEVAQAEEPAPEPSPPPPVLATEALAEEVVKQPKAEPEADPAPAKLAKAEPAPPREPPPPAPKEDAPAELAATPAPASPPRQPSATTLMSQSFETASLNAEIQQKLESHSQRPRRKFISASTRDYKYAAYMEAWRAKVERVGNLNYPDAAREQGLSGALILDVALRPDGSVQEIIVRKSSGHKVLDDAAVHIVEMAAPFAPFPRDFLDEVDILHVTRTWQFLNNYRFSSR